MRAAELHRLIENLIRLGTIAEVDHARARVRVRCGELLTAWLPWNTPRAGDAAVWDPPTLGEQVILLAPGGDPASAVVLPGIFSSAHPAPANRAGLHRRQYPDGSVIDYDEAAHQLNITVAGDATINVQGNLTATVGGSLTAEVGSTVDIVAGGDAMVSAPNVTIDANQTTCTGNLTVAGLLAFQGGMAGAGGAAGGAAATIQGSVAVTDGDVTADGITLKGHVHTGDDGGTTGAPR